MPELIYYVATSLDGYIATEDGGVDWLMPFQHSGEDYGFADFYASVDGIVMGSKTYEFALAHGEWQSKDKPSWVLSRRDLPVMHESISITSESPSSVLETAADRGCQRLWMLGGGQLAASLRDKGLLTHYSVAVIPVLLGGGIPMFAPSGTQQSLRLTAEKRFPSGVVQLDYEAAGD